jgi:tripartite-type tricarboxylate transporter receptor subunit TctC
MRANRIYRTRLSIAAIAISIGWCSMPAPAWSQTSSSQTITIVVPYPAGGTTDAAARLIAPHMAGTLGQNVVVENVGGAGGTIGTARVARARPDGHTLLVHNINMAPYPSLYTKLPFDTDRDLTAVGVINFQPHMVVGRKDLPANSVAELLAWLKRLDQPAKFAHVGAGSLPHLIGLMFAKSAGVEFNMIPYRGAAPALMDLAAGHADLYVTTPASAGQLISSGAIKGFAVTARARASAFPDIPSAAEVGYSELDIQFWNALFVPAMSPQPVLERLTRALQLALADPKVRKGFEDAGTSVAPERDQTTDAAKALLRSEFARWGEVIRENRLEVIQ